MFRERYNSKQKELFKILGAYSVYNLEIGYCQGMSQIAALLLMYLDEEDAFWALSTLVSGHRFNMHGMFTIFFDYCLSFRFECFTTSRLIFFLRVLHSWFPQIVAVSRASR